MFKYEIFAIFANIKIRNTSPRSKYNKTLRKYASKRK